MSVLEYLLNASYALLQSLHIVKTTPPPVTDTPALETTIVQATTPAHYLRAGLNDQEQRAQVVPARVHDQRVDGACQLEQRAQILARIHDQRVDGACTSVVNAQEQKQEQKEQNVDPSGRNGKQPGHEGMPTNSDLFDSQGGPFSHRSSSIPLCYERIIPAPPNHVCDHMTTPRTSSCYLVDQSKWLHEELTVETIAQDLRSDDHQYSRVMDELDALYSKLEGHIARYAEIQDELFEVNQKALVSYFHLLPKYVPDGKENTSQRAISSLIYPQTSRPDSSNMTPVKLCSMISTDKSDSTAGREECKESEVKRTERALYKLTDKLSCNEVISLFNSVLQNYSQPEVKCWYCEETGHRKWRCPRFKADIVNGFPLSTRETHKKAKRYPDPRERAIQKISNILKDLQ